MKPTRIVSLAALVLLVGCEQGSAALKAKTAAMNAEGDSLKVGRFQIVNGAPGLAKTVMLLDTRTGKAWVVCETAKEVSATTTTNWCAMRVLGTEKAP
jgi:poly(3-hydroxybutyrate) depolymerase